jgi:hypothetical protein
MPLLKALLPLQDIPALASFMIRPFWIPLTSGRGGKQGCPQAEPFPLFASPKRMSREHIDNGIAFQRFQGKAFLRVKALACEPMYPLSFLSRSENHAPDELVH